MTPWGALICHMQLKCRRADYVTTIKFYQDNNIPIWNYATAGARGPIARRHPFNYQQSIGKVETGHSMSGRVATQITEENARQYYRHWGLYMEGADWDRLYQGDAANAEAAE